jgi:hypothetical protein
VKSPLPPFHTEAVAEARRRVEHAIEEVAAAGKCMDSIDAVLTKAERT